MLGSALLIACSKDDQVATVAALEDQRAGVTHRVKAFVEAATDGRHKSGVDPISLDSLVWYVEAATNFQHGQAWLPYEVLISDTLRLQVPMAGDAVTLSIAYDAFNQLGVLLEGVNTAEQHLVLVDVELDELRGQVADLRVVRRIGFGAMKGAPSTTYNMSDDYRWLYPSGAQHTSCPCGDNPAIMSYCANGVIQRRINQANLHPLAPGEYWYDLETWFVGAMETMIAAKIYAVMDPAMVVSDDPCNDPHVTRLFSHLDVNFEDSNYCLDQDEMAYWTGDANTGTWSAIAYINSTHCPSKLFAQCVIGGGVISSPPMPCGYPWLFHVGHFTYGHIGANM